MSDTRKRIKLILLAGCMGFLCALAAASTAVFLTARSGVVKTADAKYFRGTRIIVTGDFVAMIRADESFESRDNVPADEPVSGHFSVMRIRDVSQIEFSNAFDNKPDTVPSGGADTWSISLRDYLGEYRINAAGNNGYLYLAVKGGVLYGSVRFPNWGRGVIEPLKNLRISNGTISFTRSATTPSELRYLGIATPFVQNYEGSYLHSGKTIKGSYSVQGVKKEWDARK